MKAIWIEGGRLAVIDCPQPEPQAGEALIRVRAAGICSTDLQLAAGYMGFAGIPGHEFVGEIVHAADAPHRVGQRVVGEINVSCGCCEYCDADLARHCPSRTVLGILGRAGAFAEYLTLPLDNLHTVPGMLSDERATFVEPVAAAYAILEQIPVYAHRLLVIGAGGKLGNLCARVLRSAGADVAICGRRRESLALLASEGYLLHDGPPQPIFDIVVDATGDPTSLQQAVAWTRPRGTIVLKTTTATTAPFDGAPLVVNELTLLGSRCGPFVPAIAALAAGELQPEATIGAEFSLTEAERAFAAARDPDLHARKVLFRLADQPA